MSQEQPQELPDASFEVIVSTFATQAAVALGQVPNPMTGKAEVDMAHAKFAIDLLQILEEKTKGNRGDEEDRMMNDILYRLRMLYVDKSSDSD